MWNYSMKSDQKKVAHEKNKWRAGMYGFPLIKKNKLINQIYSLKKQNHLVYVNKKK